MPLPQLPQFMKRRSMLALSMLGAALLTSCASTQVRRVLSPIPVDSELRGECEPPAQPADPVLPSQMTQFSRAQAEHGACEQARARGLLRTIDRHNEAAQ